MKTIERMTRQGVQEIVISQTTEERIKEYYAGLRLIDPTLKILSILDQNLKEFWEEEVRSYYENGELYLFVEFPLSKRNIEEHAEIRFYNDKIATMTFVVRNFRRVEAVIVDFRRKNPGRSVEFRSPIVGDIDVAESSWETMIQLLKYFNTAH